MEEQITTFKKCKAIRSSLLTRVGESLAYKSWDDNFRMKNIRDINDTIKRWEEDYGSFKIDPNDLSVEELDELGFGIWSDDLPIRLIPIWLYTFLADEFDFTDISGRKYTKLEDMDSDHRMGNLAFGVLPKKESV